MGRIEKSFAEWPECETGKRFPQVCRPQAGVKRGPISISKRRSEIRIRFNRARGVAEQGGGDAISAAAAGPEKADPFQPP